jgi:5-methylcytosine-specific restriction endonuclease McrA
MLSHKRILWNKSRRCHYCEAEFSSINEATIDHVIPKSHNGSNRLGNKVLSHMECNSAKGAAPAYLFMLYLDSKRQPKIPRGATA